LEGLASQETRPDEIIVVWQDQDKETAITAQRESRRFDLPLKLVHSNCAGIVPAENCGLEHATGEVILLIDDDAIPPAPWIKRHLSHYENPEVAAVGGPAINHFADGKRYPLRQVREIGKLKWYGKFVGNLNDSVLAPPHADTIRVDHLAGGNMSLRRLAFKRFDDHLRDYWQKFEAEVCLQVRSRGFQVLFDFTNPIFHYPVSEHGVWDNTRNGNLQRKIFNGAFNNAFILSKYSRGWTRCVRFLYLFAVGSIPSPGPLKLPFSVWRYGDPARELRVAVGVLRSQWEGWRAGLRSSRQDVEPFAATLIPGP